MNTTTKPLSKSQIENIDRILLGITKEIEQYRDKIEVLDDKKKLNLERKKQLQNRMKSVI